LKKLVLHFGKWPYAVEDDIIGATIEDEIMASESYSKAVLTGLQRENFSVADLARITGLAVTRIQSVLQEKARLTDKHLALIESAAGMTAGQLALRSTNAPDMGLAAVMNAWAMVKTSPSTRRSAGKKSRQRKTASVGSKH
jgi:hypothetical protein